MENADFKKTFIHSVEKKVVTSLQIDDQVNMNFFSVKTKGAPYYRARNLKWKQALFP